MWKFIFKWLLPLELVQQRMFRLCRSNPIRKLHNFPTLISGNFLACIPTLCSHILQRIQHIEFHRFLDILQCHRLLLSAWNAAYSQCILPCCIWCILVKFDCIFFQQSSSIHISKLHIQIHCDFDSWVLSNDRPFPKKDHNSLYKLRRLDLCILRYCWVSMRC